MSRKKQIWAVGDIFVVQQKDGKACLGQVLDLMMPNVPSCSFYDLRPETRDVPVEVELPFSKVIAAHSTTREQLDRGYWKVIGRCLPALPQQFWPNEPYRCIGWVGAKTYGAGIIERFLDAFFGCAPWDYYPEPRYFDRMLFSPAVQPKNRLLKRQMVPP